MRFEPNALGIYDLTGHAWEWCQDWINEPRRQRVVRGGSWGTKVPTEILSSGRGMASVRNSDRGFRVVAEPETAAK